jgi:hypothetical protein
VEKCGTAGQATDDNVLSECEIRIAFPRQQWLRERASMLRYTHISSLLRQLLNHLLSVMVDTIHIKPHINISVD